MQLDINTRHDSFVFQVQFITSHQTGKQIASPCLLRTARTQLGYGVLAPPSKVPVNNGAPDDDGLFLTNIETGECRLLVSLRQIVDAMPSFTRR